MNRVILLCSFVVIVVAGAGALAYENQKLKRDIDTLEAAFVEAQDHWGEEYMKEKRAKRALEADVETLEGGIETLEAEVETLEVELASRPAIERAQIIVVGVKDDHWTCEDKDRGYTTAVTWTLAGAEFYSCTRPSWWIGEDKTKLCQQDARKAIGYPLPKSCEYIADGMFGQ